MGHRPWREISKKTQKSPERIARIESETRAMHVIAALTALREALGFSQSALSSALGVSQARVSQIENQEDLNLSTLDGIAQAMGGQLRMSIAFPDQTVELLGRREYATSGRSTAPRHVIIRASHISEEFIRTQRVDVEKAPLAVVVGERLKERLLECDA